MPVLTMTLLGPPQMSDGDGTPVLLRSRKQLALLAYLAVERRREQRRETLLGLLWPEVPEDAARNNLRVALADIRRLLGPAATLLRTDRSVVGFDLDDEVCLDIAAFNAAIAAWRGHTHAASQVCAECRAQLTAAAELYAGEFAQGLTLTDAPAWDDWAVVMREQLHQQALDVLNALAALCEQAGDHASAGRYARRQLALEPWREAAHRQLMRALAAVGDRTAALAAYERCRQVLHVELGVAPDEETSALEAQIRADVAAIRAPQQAARRPLGAVDEAPPMATPPGSTPPLDGAGDAAQSGRLTFEHDWSEAPETGQLYGRTAEAAQLDHWLLDERCRLIAVLGMGGVGKTTLAALVARSVAGQFDRVIWRSLLNAPPFEELLRPVLQSLAAPTPIDLPVGLDEQLTLLLDWLRRHRCLLILDNLESLLDGDGRGRMRPGYEGYAALLQRVAHSQHRSCLMLTSREGPQGLDRWEADLPGVRALRLEGLDADAGEAILATWGLAGQASDARALVARYGGHPLALKLVAQTVHELFGGAVGDFLREDTPIFDDIRAVLDQQLARLSPLEQALLTWLAIEREPTSVATLRSNLLQQQATGPLVEALRALQRRSLLERVGNGVTLPNVVIEYLTERLVTAVCAELLDAGESSSSRGEQERVPLPERLATLNRFALVKTQATEYVRQSQRRMILQPVAERLVAELGTDGLAARVQEILAGLRALAPRANGYSAGNLLNLLLQAGVDVSGYNFSRLCVWQADLQGRVGVELNLGAADLTGSIFTLILYPAAVVVGPEGDMVIAGSDANDLCLWRAAHGQLQLAFRTPGQATELQAVSPDGQLVAAGCWDDTMRVWSAATGTLLHTLEWHGGVTLSGAFSHDGQLVAAGSSDDTVYLWDLNSGRSLPTLRHPLLRRSRLAFRPALECERRVDMPMLASGGDEQVICVWDLEHGQIVDELRGHAQTIECLAFAPDGSLLASGSHDGLILLWSVDTSGRGHLSGTLRGHSHIVRAVVFHPDGQLLASGSADGTVRLWNVSTGEMRQLLARHGHEITALAFDPAGRVLATVSEDRGVRLWEVETGRPLDSLTGYMNAVLVMHYRPDGRQLASASGDGRIHLWDTRTSRTVGMLPGYAGRLNAFAYSPDGRMLATASSAATVQLWDLAGGTPIRTLRGQQGDLKSLAFSPDGRWLAGGGVDRTIFFWSIQDGAAAYAEAAARVLHGHADDIETVAYSPDGRLLVSSSLDHTARLWSLDSGEVIHVLTGHAAALAAAAFSPRGDRIATISYDDTLRLWDVATGRLVDGWDSISARGKAVAFSPSGALLAHTHNHVELVLRDVESGAVVRTLCGHSGYIFGLEWSPSEPMVASSSSDGTVRLWNVDSGACEHILEPPGPYAGMNIAGAIGISDAQRQALQALGAVEDSPGTAAWPFATIRETGPNQDS